MNTRHADHASALAETMPPADANATAAAGADLPSEHIYLVACGEPSAGTPAPSPRTMGLKAWNLLAMARLGLPVPPAVVLGTGFANGAADHLQGRQPGRWKPALAALERATGTRLGDPGRPLLVSVRSGASVSMPGMLETVLNVGLSDATVEGLIRRTGNPRLAWDAYRRLVAAYGEVVAGIPAERFEEAGRAPAPEGDERALDFAELRELAHRHLSIYAGETGQPFPQEPLTQLEGAIGAVLHSWHAPKAREYRRIHTIPDDIGTAVTLQAMVFGNAGGRSGSGVGFTRDPATGEPQPWVDFLFNAQGEDVVSGRRSAHGHGELARVLPEVWQALQAAMRTLERSMGDMQDFEFTVQEGRLFLLQTRDGKRTARAAARIALDLWEEGLIDAREAQARTAGLDAEALSRLRIVAADGEAAQPLARAASAAGGIAIGEIALDEARALARSQAGHPVVLVRRDAETSDIGALEVAAGLLTQRGARTSHAAVVARQAGKVCLVGCEALRIDLAGRSVTVGDVRLGEGDLITLDGNDGSVYTGAAHAVVEREEALLRRLAGLRETADSASF